MQCVDLGEELESRQGSLGVGVDEISGIQLDSDIVLPWKGVVLVSDVRSGVIHLSRQILYILEGDLNLLSLATNDDSLERLLPVQKRNRRMCLREEIKHSRRLGWGSDTRMQQMRYLNEFLITIKQ